MSLILQKIKHRLTRPLLPIFLLSVSLASCSSMPAFGPDDASIKNTLEVDGSAATDLLPFEVINVTSSTLPPLKYKTSLFPNWLIDQGFSKDDEIVGFGDDIEIKIWEIGEDSLFETSGNHATSINVNVSNSGKIVVPYAGEISVVGITTSQLRELVLSKYKGQASEPEIVVTIKSTESRFATVLGAVRNPGRVLIPSRGIQLLDLIAKSGGAPTTPWEVDITVQRNKKQATNSLFNIINVMENNIIVLPGDTINVSHQPRRFTVYGGVNKPSNIEIPFKDAHLAFLLAEVGGLNDRVAETRSVFVFRSSDNGTISSAYRFDFSRPDAFLLAGKFYLDSTDVTYVASSDAADFQKFISFILSPLFTTSSAIKRITP